MVEGCERLKLHYVNASLARFAFRDVALWLVQSLGDLDLRQAGFDPGLPELN